MNSAVLFQGQGQYHTDYIRKLLRDTPSLKSIWIEAEQILGWSPESLLNHTDNVGSLTTDYAQPLIFLMEMTGWYRFSEMMKQPPSFFAGHSLGELTALTAAGAISFQNGLQLVAKRGELMQQCMPEIAQGMLALRNCTIEQAKQLCLQAFEETGERCYCANYNASNNIVLSGTHKALSWIAARDNLRTVSLSVTRAFHTAFMKHATDQLMEYIHSKKISFILPEIPVLSNFTGRPYQTSWSFPELICRQIISPVQWKSCIEYLHKSGTTVFLQVSDSHLFEAMARSDLSHAYWGNLEEVASGKVYDFDALYPAATSRKKYIGDLKSEILCRMTGDPWPEAVTSEQRQKAKTLYLQTTELLSDRDISKDAFMQAVNNLNEILKMKRISEQNLIEILIEKYGLQGV